MSTTSRYNVDPRGLANRRRATLLGGILALVLATGGGPAPADDLSGAASAAPSRYPASEVAAFAKKVEGEAASRQALVFLLARVGRPPDSLPPGIHYTHTGFAVYAPLRRPDGTVGHGYVTYNLYQSAEDPGRSYLATDFPADFFADITVLRAGIAIPVKPLQRRLLTLIGTERYRALHNPRYSVLSNPSDPTYENCNEFVLDVLQSAIYETGDRRRIKANNVAYFTPQPVVVNPLALLIGVVFKPDVRTSDHPGGDIATATFGSLVAYLERYGLLEEQLVVQP